MVQATRRHGRYGGSADSDGAHIYLRSGGRVRNVIFEVFDLFDCWHCRLDQLSDLGGLLVAVLIRKGLGLDEPGVNQCRYTDFNVVFLARRNLPPSRAERGQHSVIQSITI